MFLFLFFSLTDIIIQAWSFHHTHTKGNKMSRGASSRQAKSELEDLLKAELQTTVLRSQGPSGGGCISEGSTYDTDSGKVFIKVNHNKEVSMFLSFFVWVFIYLFILFYFWERDIINYIWWKTSMVDPKNQEKHNLKEEWSLANLNVSRVCVISSQYFKFWWNTLYTVWVVYFWKTAVLHLQSFPLFWGGGGGVGGGGDI